MYVCYVLWYVQMLNMYRLRCMYLYVCYACSNLYDGSCFFYFYWWGRLAYFLNVGKNVIGGGLGGFMGYI